MYLKPLYSEEALAKGMTTDKADMIFASIPYKIHAVLDVPTYTAMAQRDAPFYKRLTDVGFLLDFGEDGSGLFMKWLRRGAGFYIDTGDGPPGCQPQSSHFTRLLSAFLSV